MRFSVFASPFIAHKKSRGNTSYYKTVKIILQKKELRKQFLKMQNHTDLFCFLNIAKTIVTIIAIIVKNSMPETI